MLKRITEINKYHPLHPSYPKHDENQYLNLLQDIIEDGVVEEGRNGKTKSIFGASMHF